VDYLRFTNELEGTALPEEREGIVRSILEGDVGVSDVIEDFLKDAHLPEEYEAGYNENSDYPGTKCLVNYFNIKDKNKLKQIEQFFCDIRCAELFRREERRMLCFQYLCEIHEHLFGDVYPSAGSIRTAVASKLTEFCHPDYIEKSANALFSKLAKAGYLARKDLERDDFLNEVAYFIGELEAIHPFSEGNGRAIRFFLDRLVLNAGYTISWADADPDRMLEGSIAAIDGDCQPLIDVLEEIIQER